MANHVIANVLCEAISVSLRGLLRRGDRPPRKDIKNGNNFSKIDINKLLPSVFVMRIAVK
jgi:hypothetical protein